MDSGADESFIDQSLAKQLQVKLEPILSPLVANVLDGYLLCHVTHLTPPLGLLVSGNHSERHVFHIIDSPDLPLILGFPWLKKHNPYMD